MESYKKNFICYSDSANIPDRIGLEFKDNIEPQNGVIKHAHGKLGEITFGIEKSESNMSLIFRTGVYEDLKLLFNSHRVTDVNQFAGKEIIIYEKDGRIVAVAPKDNSIYRSLTMGFSEPPSEFC